ncbi:carbohydrate kinase family protein [Kutzneria albida]|uniref:Carbohydrate kinase PfkB domain-containing protein n=1 Tax=Kutzneria albida DSM 43870 TaxID=1449976 RepID=W5W349_9PSEU|nr:PfkB family carbohydrate kinase [Kutzneria albida]AHH94936.1 hypothetical protein KALB_1564 [Kutzneria albida DSM 43870]
MQPSQQDTRVLVAGSVSPDHQLAAESTSRSVAGGGHAGRSAATLARLGTRPSLFSAVGDDQEDLELVTELDQLGIDTSTLLTVPGARANQVVIPTFSGRSFVLTSRDPAERMGIEECRRLPPLRQFAAALVCDPSATVILWTLAAARAARVPTVWKPTGLFANSPWFRSAAASADVLQLNANQYSAAFGPDADPGPVRQLLGVACLVITAGHSGAVVVTEEGVGEFEGYEEELLDPGAAADGFAAAFTAVIAVSAGVDLATRAGCLAGTILAAEEPLPDLGELLDRVLPDSKNVRRATRD